MLGGILKGIQNSIRVLKVEQYAQAQASGLACQKNNIVETKSKSLSSTLFKGGSLVRVTKKQNQWNTHTHTDLPKIV